MKYLLFVFFLLFTPSLFAQTIEVTTIGSTAGNNAQTFSLDQAQLNIQGQGITVDGENGQALIGQAQAYHLSDNGSYFSAIHLDNDLTATMYEGSGLPIFEIELNWFDPFDRTLDIITFDDGRFVTRDNVANFSFYDPDGNLLYNVSNSSSSTHGEVASEITANPAGTTVLLTNPRINFNGNEGSRAQVVYGENDIREIYSSRDRILKHSDVTESGSYIILITEQSGTSDEVLVLDRFGNEIAGLTTDEELIGATLSGDARFLTIYTSNRVQVYNTDNMERLGSTSFRVNVNYAFYSEPDQQIIALCGARSGGNQISNPEIHAIHLEKRSIARTDINYALAWLDYNQLNMNRVGADQFQLTGLNRDLSITTQF